ncbi:unnamed protein product [Acanthoscelides obtectus]|uniref:Uncharacterized protein n=1 Tax=Acanthoscelides obtectus TaxID=200917 RepID=A0A9P0PSR1_ACAOB|nr:unnamed protein product [Acanthoscelides obtectus]CAK1671062.1 hypothetical protein AOBTE_LOCUS28028 [Acanthoscelides obtectus]
MAGKEVYTFRELENMSSDGLYALLESIPLDGESDEPSTVDWGDIHLKGEFDHQIIFSARTSEPITAKDSACVRGNMAADTLENPNHAEEL